MWGKHSDTSGPGDRKRSYKQTAALKRTFTSNHTRIFFFWRKRTKPCFCGTVQSAVSILWNDAAFVVADGSTADGMTSILAAFTVCTLERHNLGQAFICVPVTVAGPHLRRQTSSDSSAFHDKLLRCHAWLPLCLQCWIKIFAEIRSTTELCTQQIFASVTVKTCISGIFTVALAFLQPSCFVNANKCEHN